MNIVKDKKLVDFFETMDFKPEDIREIGQEEYRVKSAYGPGDFRVLPNGNIENSWAGFYGHEEKVCYVEELEKTSMGYEVVSFYMI